MMKIDFLMVRVDVGIKPEPFILSPELWILDKLYEHFT